MIKKCVCGNEFEWQDFGGSYKNKKYCSGSCRQRAYRQTEYGRERTKKYNERYKREDRVWLCDICGKEISSPRRRVFCDVCRGSKTSIYRDRMVRLNPELHKSYRYIDNLRHKIRRGTVKVSPCSVCGTTEDIHYHHPDYNKPTEVVSLCKVHHFELHKGA